LGECGKNYQKKDGQLIELVLMNLRTPFNMFMSTFCTNWKAHKEDGKDYTFEYFCGLLITNQHNCLKKESLVVNIKPTFSRERERWIPGIEYGLMPLHRNLHTMTRNLRDRQMHPNEVERRRHVSIVERLDMWRKYAIRREMI
jgi:hypothetical protein